MPVNPNEKSVLGETSYSNLASISERVDVVNIFRRSEDILPIVQEAIRIGAKAVWMQEGIVNAEAAKNLVLPIPNISSTAALSSIP
ncbi:CoA-binding protein [Chloroflexota bacterium]